MSKKARSTRKADVEEEITIEAKLKFELIEQTLQKYKLKRMVSYLCEVMGVFRSGFYNYFNEKSAQNRANQKEVDSIALQKSVENLADSYGRYYKKQSKYPRLSLKRIPFSLIQQSIRTEIS